MRFDKQAETDKQVERSNRNWQLTHTQTRILKSTSTRPLRGCHPLFCRTLRQSSCYRGYRLLPAQSRPTPSPTCNAVHCGRHRRTVDPVSKWAPPSKCPTTWFGLYICSNMAGPITCRTPYSPLLHISVYENMVIHHFVRSKHSPSLISRMKSMRL